MSQFESNTHEFTFEVVAKETAEDVTRVDVKMHVTEYKSVKNEAGYVVDGCDGCVDDEMGTVGLNTVEDVRDEFDVNAEIVYKSGACPTDLCVGCNGTEKGNGVFSFYNNSTMFVFGTPFGRNAKIVSRTDTTRTVLNTYPEIEIKLNPTEDMDYEDRCEIVEKSVPTLEQLEDLLETLKMIKSLNKA